MKLKQSQPEQQTELRKQLTSVVGLYGSDTYYVQPGTLLELQNISHRMPSKYGVIKNSSTVFPITFMKLGKDENPTQIVQSPPGGSVFLVLGYEFVPKPYDTKDSKELFRNDVILLRFLWEEEVILAMVNVRDYSLRQMFSIKQHSIDS